mgnify:CR=1 FL=1
MITTRLTKGQVLVLAAATLPMIGAGALGGLGTYTNIVTEFGRAETALGVVAAGEGVTLVLALVMVGLTMLGQAAPAPVRLGLWGAPIAASLTGIVVADTVSEAVVYAMTPMAMSASAEGLGLLARRIVVHRTGVDMEVQRRNADTVQRLAYHRARAANHPSDWARKRSERASWRLAKRVGVGDTELGAQLVQVQRERLHEGADAALLDMLSVVASTPRPAFAPAAGTESGKRSIICAGTTGLLPVGRRTVPAAPTPSSPRRLPVLAAEKPRTRTVVRAEYVPERDADGAPVVDPDPLLDAVRRDHPELLAMARTPSVRLLRSEYGIGQARAQRIRDAFLPRTVTP